MNYFLSWTGQFCKITVITLKKIMRIEFITRFAACQCHEAHVLCWASLAQTEISSAIAPIASSCTVAVEFAIGESCLAGVDALQKFARRLQRSRLDCLSMDLPAFEHRPHSTDLNPIELMMSSWATEKFYPPQFAGALSLLRLHLYSRGESWLVCLKVPKQVDFNFGY